MDAEDLLLREFLGIRDAEETGARPRWIRSQQRADGTWANFHGGDGDLSTTVEAYAALRLAGDPADAEHMRARGGLRPRARRARAARGCSRTSGWRCSACGPGSDLPALPPEMMFLPASGAAEHLRLRVLGAPDGRRRSGGDVRAARPAAAASTSTSCDQAEPLARPPRRATAATAERLASAWIARRGSTSAGPLPPLRAAALARAERWIVARQEADGSWGGIQPPWVYSLMALHLRGYPLDHPVMRAGLEGLERFMIARLGGRGAWRPARARSGTRRSPSIALTDAGRGRRRPGAGARPPTGCWTRRCASPGDWAVRAPGPGPGRVGVRVRQRQLPGHRRHRRGGAGAAAGRRTPTRERLEAAIARGVAWTLGMQSRDGGWGAFDADNTRSAPARPSVLRLRRGHRPAERRRDRPRDRDAGRRARRRPRPCAARRRVAQRRRRSPTARGSAAGASTTSTAPAPAVLALVAAGAGPEDQRIRRAVEWLEQHQNDDGGWGEDARSYVDPAWIGRGPEHRLADGAGRCSRSRAGEARRRPGARHRLAGRSPSCPTGAGTSPSTPAPASRGTSTSTTTSTASCSRSWRLGRCLRGRRERRHAAMPAPAASPPARRGGHEPGGRRELPGRQPPAPAPRSAGTCWPSTASPAWSTTSATRRRGPPGAPRRRRARAGRRLRRPARARRSCATWRRRSASCAMPRAPLQALIEANRQDQVAPLRDVLAARGVLRAVGQPGRRARPAHLRRGHAGARWRSRTGSAPRSSSPSTGRTWPRTTRAAASISPPRTWSALAARPATSPLRPRARARPRAHALRGRAGPRDPRRGRAAIWTRSADGPGWRSRASWRAGAPRWARSSAAATTSAPARRGPPAGRARRRSPAALIRAEGAMTRRERLPALRGDHARGGANFFYGIRLLPASKKRAMCAVYAFARRVDDVGDGDLPPDEKIALLAEERARLDGAGRRPTIPCWSRCATPMRASRCPGTRCTASSTGWRPTSTAPPTTPSRSWSSTAARSRARSAGSRWRSSGPPTGSERPGWRTTWAWRCSSRTSCATCARTPSGDGSTCRARTSSASTAPTARSPAPPDAARDLIRFEATRDREWFARGMQLLPMLDSRSAACVGAMTGIYRRILDRIERAPEEVMHRRIALPPWEKAWVATWSLANGAAGGQWTAAVAGAHRGNGGNGGTAPPRPARRTTRHDPPGRHRGRRARRHLGGPALRRRGRRGDAAGGSPPPGRRRLLLRARRAEHRQRPARLPALLHRVRRAARPPGLPLADHAAAPPGDPGARPGGPGRVAATLGTPRPAASRRRAGPLPAPAARRAGARRRRRARAGARGPGRPAQRRDHLRRLAARARAEPAPRWRRSGT